MVDGRVSKSSVARSPESLTVLIFWFQVGSRCWPLPRPNLQLMIAQMLDEFKQTNFGYSAMLDCCKMLDREAGVAQW